jgi:hypothetical protein
MALSRTVVEMSETILFTNTTAKSLFTLPIGAVPLFASVHVKTAFNGSGTNLLSIGKAGSAAYYASGVPLDATGAVLIALNESDTLEKRQGITATFTDGAADATAGRAIVRVVYSTPFRPV